MPREIELTDVRNKFCLKVMRENNITELKELATFLGISKSTAHVWAHRESIMPREDAAAKVAAKLKISVRDVIAGLLGIAEAS